ncbi:MAG TPA: D-alanine--D-alanine ligase [Clostridiaceae bacterium]|nr:D-alanine--D-alanine ligase [Clostridiaceae bacterium]
MKNKKRIAVIFGGQSTEHEVSRFSAQSVIENLDKNKFEVVMIGITKEGKWLKYNGPVEKIGSGEWEEIAVRQRLENIKNIKSLPRYDGFQQSDEEDNEDSNDYCDNYQIDNNNSAREILLATGVEDGNNKIDVVFPVLHGLNGEDGTIQGLFELANIPYVGCGVLGSALGMDKAIAKIIFEKEGIPIGKYVAFSKKQFFENQQNIIGEIEKKLGYPCFVKPCNSGSSVGVSKAKNRDELIEAVNYATNFDRRILVEEFINGREIECAVLGNDNPEASTVGEIIPGNEFYDYDDKYSSESRSKLVIPAELPSETIEKIREYAVRAFKALDCSGLARVDFFVHKETGEIYINEVNTMPGFTKISMYPKLWEASGLPYSKLLEKLIDLAVERHNEKEMIRKIQRGN